MGEDVKLHRHFLTLSLDATKRRLGQTLTLSLVQYGVMVLITGLAVRAALAPSSSPRSLRRRARPDGASRALTTPAANLVRTRRRRQTLLITRFFDAERRSFDFSGLQTTVMPRGSLSA